MKLETLFLICNLIVLPCWASLLLVPRWKWAQRIAMYYAPLLLAIAYIGLFIANFEGLHANYQSFGAVQYAFHSPGLVLAAWIHFLAFDLFIGAWMVERCTASGHTASGRDSPASSSRFYLAPQVCCCTLPCVRD